MQNLQHNSMSIFYNQIKLSDHRKHTLDYYFNKKTVLMSSNKFILPVPTHVEGNP